MQQPPPAAYPDMMNGGAAPAPAPAQAAITIPAEYSEKPPVQPMGYGEAPPAGYPGAAPAGQPAPYPGQGPYGTPGQPAAGPYAANPSYGAPAGPYGAQQAAPYPGQPGPYGAQPGPYGAQPGQPQQPYRPGQSGPPPPGFRCTAGWIIFGFGVLFPILWLFVPLMYLITKDPQDLQASKAALMAFAFYMILLFVIVLPLALHWY